MTNSEHRMARPIDRICKVESSAAQQYATKEGGAGDWVTGATIYTDDALDGVVLLLTIFPGGVLPLTLLLEALVVDQLAGSVLHRAFGTLTGGRGFLAH